MDIISALMKENVRLFCGHRWLFYEDEEWVVMEHPYRAKKNKCLCKTQIQDEAVKSLLGESA